MIHLPGVLEAAKQVQGLCERESWRFCFIGGVAVQRWGEPRLTQDVDLTLLTGFGTEESYVDTLLAALSPRRDDAREFAAAIRQGRQPVCNIHDSERRRISPLS